MAEIQRSVLFEKLSTVGYKSLESATVFCKMRGNPYVELVHWIQQILQMPESDLAHILRRVNVNEAHLAQEMTAALDALPRGASSISDLSSQMDLAIERGWVYGTLLFGQNRVRTGHLLVGLLKTVELRNTLYSMSGEFRKVKLDALTDDFASLVDGSTEESSQSGVADVAGAEPGEASGARVPTGKLEALAQYSVDLTEQARSGDMDPIIGRDDEIRQIVDILMRRRQNNPILTGEAGVGKTAVVEGFAQRVAAGDVPPSLRDVAVRTLDLGALQAGASMKGEFENRLKQVIEEVQSSEKPIILFIDEAHTLIGAGGAAGQGDAANLLKPALARGTLRTVAATTWAEYKKYFEKDPALTRRFQVIRVEEPSEEKAVQMMRRLAATLEKHHRVQLLDEGLESAVSLSHRYIPARQLPDKAVSLIDTACARVAVSQHATPAEVDDSRRRIETLTTEIEIVERERQVGIAHEVRLVGLHDLIDAERERLAALEADWEAEKQLVDRILELRSLLREAGLAVEPDAKEEADGEASEEAETTEPPVDVEAVREELYGLQAELSELQGENPLILPAVDAQAVASVVADWTGIPVGRMVKNEIESVLKLADTLEERVIGQRHGLDMIARRIQTSRAGMVNPNRPIGVFMLAGPSGVGKTETALSLAEAIYGGEHNLVTINMSEFQEAHTVSTLKGAPPGYVGYGEGGILTEAVRRKPYSVVLLDEVEKAHPDVHEIFFQVFDKGMMEDGEGRMIDFKNTIILLTSNVGSELIMNLCSDPDLMPEPDGIAQALREPLLKVFPAALLGRLVVIPYYPISEIMLRAILQLQIRRIQERVRNRHEIELTVTEAVENLVAERCTEAESGARAIDAILTNSLLPEISREYLVRLAAGDEMSTIEVDAVDSEFRYTFS